jgi:hypothetical protein
MDLIRAERLAWAAVFAAVVVPEGVGVPRAGVAAAVFVGVVGLAAFAAGWLVAVRAKRLILSAIPM